MRKFIPIFCLILAMSGGYVYGQDYIADFDNQYLPVLNELLRKSESAITDLEEATVNVADVTGIVAEANGGTGSDTSSLLTGSFFIQSNTMDTVVGFDQGTSGYYLQSQGVGNDSTWTSIPVTYSGEDILTAASGTWTSPSNVTKIYLTMLGGGGGGAADNGGANWTGAGGGAAGYIVDMPYTVTGSTGYDYVVGAGGLGGSYAAGTGNTGSATTFDSGAISVVGGVGGTSGSSGGVGGIAGIVVSSDNFVGQDAVSTTGGAGGGSTLETVFALSLGHGGIGSGGTNAGGGGAGTPYGFGGDGGDKEVRGNSAADNTGAGGGGNGWNTGQRGGDGGSGIIIIKY